MKSPQTLLETPRVDMSQGPVTKPPPPPRGRFEPESVPPPASRPGGSARSDLPESYGHSRLVVLTIDPYHVHAYWEMTLRDRMRAWDQLDPDGAAEAEWVLRFYDVTYIEFDGTNAHGFFDVEVGASARNWYVELWSPEKTYFVEIGLRKLAHFMPVCRSNFVHVPRADPPPRAEAPRAEPFVDPTSAAAMTSPASADAAGSSPARAEERPPISADEYREWLKTQATLPSAAAAPDPGVVPGATPLDFASVSAPALGARDENQRETPSAVLTPAPNRAAGSAGARPAAQSRSVSLEGGSGSGSAGSWFATLVERPRPDTGA